MTRREKGRFAHQDDNSYIAVRILKMPILKQHFQHVRKAQSGCVYMYMPDCGPKAITRVERQDERRGGGANSSYDLVVILDTGSPSLGIMKACCAATDARERHIAPRPWGGCGKTAPLVTSTVVRLSIQFLRGGTPSMELAVLACIVPRGTLQHPVRLGRDSYMRFKQRIYTTAPRQQSQPTFGGLSLLIPNSDHASGFTQDDQSKGDIFHLRYAGVQSVSLSSTPSLAKVDLRLSKAAQLTLTTTWLACFPTMGFLPTRKPSPSVGTRL